MSSVSERTCGDVYPELTHRIVGSAIAVHRALGPGLLESTYRDCLVHRLRHDGMSVSQEVPIPVRYLGAEVGVAFRADIIVEATAIVELKAVERLLPVHSAQVLTYMKLARLPVGLLINFNVSRLVTGVRRLIRPQAPP